MHKKLNLIQKYLRKAGLICGLNLYSQYTYDASLLMKAAALVAATANGSLILDVGTGLLDAELVIDVTALETDTGDESYEIIVQGSPDAAFGTAGNIKSLASITIGDSGSTRGTLIGNGADDAVGRFVLPFRNERNGTTFQYIRVRTVVVGTIATGINYSAFVAKS